MSSENFQKSSTGETQNELNNSPDSSFITLSKSDSKFKAYIDGSFSKELIAIPAKNLNVNTKNEQVTFKLIPFAEVKRPKIPKLIWQLSRGPMAGMALAPAISIWALTQAKGLIVETSEFAQALLAIFFLQLSVFLYNDFTDHIDGSDRMVSIERKKYLQLGWLRPFHILRFAQLSLLVGMLLGLLLVAKNPVVLSVIALATAVGIFGYSFPNVGFKRLGLSELAVFWCFGPLITIGMQQLLVGTTIKEALLLEAFLVGFVFGHINVLIVQMRQLESSCTDAAVKVKTFAVRLGFDKSKSFMLLQLVGHILITAVVCWYLNLSIVFGTVALIYCAGLVRVFIKLKSIDSPMGSRLMGLSDEVALLSLGLALVAAAFGIYAG